MAITIEKEIRQTEETQVNLRHMKILADAMAPDPTEWRYEGEIEEAGDGLASCACGHPIRYCFPIRRPRDGAILIIGSVCIEKSIPYLIAHGAEALAQGLQAGTERLNELIKERQKRIRDAQSNARYAALKVIADQLLEWRDGIWARRHDVHCSERYTRRLYIPKYWYEGSWKNLEKDPSQTTPGRAATSLEKAITRFLKEVPGLREEFVKHPSYKGCWAECPYTLEAFETEAALLRQTKGTPTAEREEAVETMVVEEKPEELSDAEAWSKGHAANLSLMAIRRDACGPNMEAMIQAAEERAAAAQPTGEQAERIAAHFGARMIDCILGCGAKIPMAQPGELQETICDACYSKMEEQEEAAERMATAPVEAPAEPSLIGKQYICQAGPYQGMTVTVIARGSVSGKGTQFWVVRTARGTTWEVGEPALRRTLGLA